MLDLIPGRELELKEMAFGDKRADGSLGMQKGPPLLRITTIFMKEEEEWYQANQKFKFAALRS